MTSTSLETLGSVTFIWTQKRLHHIELEIHVLAWDSIKCGGVEPVNKIPILRLDNGSPTAKHIKICTDSIPLTKLMTT
jgi:hypothetical protein